MKIWNHRSFAALYFVTDDDGHVIADGLSRQAAEALVVSHQVVRS